MASGNEISLSGLMDIVRNLEDATSMSLTQFTKRSTINGRVYVQEAVQDNEIIPDVMKVCMNMYTGFIMTAMQMSQYVTHAKTARDMMSIVATESFQEEYIDLVQASESFFGLEADPKKESKGYLDRFNPSKGPLDTNTGASTGGKVVDVNSANALPAFGRIIEMQFGNAKSSKPGDPQGGFTLHMYLQLQPIVIADAVADAFVTTNLPPSVKQRWLQYKAGEISFWKDFLGAQDQLRARRKALKADKTGELANMFERQENAVTTAWGKMTMLFPEKQNIASSIMIFDKAAFKVACHKSGLNFSRFGDRQRFFNKAFALMVVLVDQEYNKVEFYFHGLELVAEYNYKDIKSNAKDAKYDLTELMQSMSRGMAPRF